jgi:quinol monooxygenase YgiN
LGAAAIYAVGAMLVEYIRYEVPLAQRDEFLAAYRSAGEELAASENCVGYEVAEGAEEPSHFTVRIEWDSLEGHEQGFRGSAQFATFLGQGEAVLRADS